MSALYPDLYVRTIFDIDYEGLKRQGCKGIMYDLDNTLAPYDQAYPDQDLIDLFEKLQDQGFRIALVSNNNRRRVTRFNEKLNIDAYPRANKPFTKVLKNAILHMGLQREEVVFVGDQLFTDVWVGNRLGLLTVLVKPIQEKEQSITWIKRGIERRILDGFLKKKGKERFK